MLINNGKADLLFGVHMLSIATDLPADGESGRPERAARWALAWSASGHLAAAAALIAIGSLRTSPIAGVSSVSAPARIDASHIVFLAPPAAGAVGGGGGGGNRNPDPIRRAESPGTDRITLRVAKPVTTSPQVIDTERVLPALPALLLDAVPLANGLVEQIGLPSGGTTLGTSTGPGSGGGVGDGVGTGIGSGRGPGLGPGSGGGTGGGIYRTGGGVTAPQLISQVRPSYTPDALDRRIQGSVELQLVVTTDGAPSDIRVVRSLDPAGLDEEAIKAVRQWKFKPGRLAATPVNVLVTVVLDFMIH